MGRGKDTDYQSKKAAALAQAEQNDFIFGIHSVYEPDRDWETKYFLDIF